MMPRESKSHVVRFERAYGSQCGSETFDSQPLNHFVNLCMKPHVIVDLTQEGIAYHVYRVLAACD